MNNKCTLTVGSREIEFIFDNNSLYEFCDCAGIDLSGYEKYIMDHPGTFMRSMFYAAARVASKYSGNPLTVGEGKDERPMSEMDFGLLMAEFKEPDYSKLIKAFEASRPEVKKKAKPKRKILARK